MIGRRRQQTLSGYLFPYEHEDPPPAGSARRIWRDCLVEALLWTAVSTGVCLAVWLTDVEPVARALGGGP